MPAASCAWIQATPPREVAQQESSPSITFRGRSELSKTPTLSPIFLGKANVELQRDTWGGRELLWSLVLQGGYFPYDFWRAGTSQRAWFFKKVNYLVGRSWGGGRGSRVGTLLCNKSPTPLTNKSGREYWALPHVDSEEEEQAQELSLIEVDQQWSGFPVRQLWIISYGGHKWGENPPSLESLAWTMGHGPMLASHSLWSSLGGCWGGSRAKASWVRVTRWTQLQESYSQGTQNLSEPRTSCKCLLWVVALLPLLMGC